MYQILSVIVITIAFVFYSRASSRDTTSARQKGCAFALTTYSVTSFSLSLFFFFFDSTGAPYTCVSLFLPPSLLPPPLAHRCESAFGRLKNVNETRFFFFFFFTF